MQINFRFRFWSRACPRCRVTSLYQILCTNTFIEYGDISILRNSIWPPSAILDKRRGTTQEGPFMVAILCKNFNIIVLVVFYVISIWFFCRSRLKVLFMVAQFQFWEVQFPKFSELSFRPKKGISTHKCRVVSHWVLIGPDRTRRVVALCICTRRKFGQLWTSHQTSQENPLAKGAPYWLFHHTE